MASWKAGFFNFNWLGLVDSLEIPAYLQAESLIKNNLVVIIQDQHSGIRMTNQSFIVIFIVFVLNFNMLKIPVNKIHTFIKVCECIFFFLLTGN